MRLDFIMNPPLRCSTIQRIPIDVDALIYPNINLGKLSGIHLRHFSFHDASCRRSWKGDQGKVAVCLTFILDRKLIREDGTKIWRDGSVILSHLLISWQNLIPHEIRLRCQNSPCINISHRSENCHVNLWQEKLYAQNGLRSSCPPEPAT